MDKRTRNLASVGLLVVVAGVLFVWGLFWMLGTPLLRGGMDVTVVLDNGGGLKRSDPVHLQGVSIGQVKSVKLNPAGGVLVDLRLENNLALPTDTRATVRGDVFGAHIVELLPGTAMISLGANDTIRGASSPELSQIAADLSTRVGSVLANADNLLSADAVRDVHATASVLPASAQELRAVFAELRLASAALRRSAENVERAEAGTAVRGALGEVERSAQALTIAAGRMEESLGAFASVLNKIDAGSGTLGRLVNDESVYDELSSTLREVRALATDIRERPSRYITVRIF
jgi:phospholipid/cholesterol/gamma-HCH transport system substrate-binding protein